MSTRRSKSPSNKRRSGTVLERILKHDTENLTRKQIKAFLVKYKVSTGVVNGKYESKSDLSKALVKAIAVYHKKHKRKPRSSIKPQIQHDRSAYTTGLGIDDM